MDYTSLENIKKWLNAHLTQERYEHSIGTAECAEKLASKYGLDKEKAYLAGLVHDCAKTLSKEESLEIMKSLTLCGGELDNPKTYHAPVGAYIAQTELNITDADILSAIRWHTLGKINMTDFEKIIFIADKIEERTRPCQISSPIKEALEKEGLDKALLVCYKNTIKSLVDRELKICTTTIDIYNSLL